VNRKRALWRRLLVVALLVLSLAMLTLYFRESNSGPVHRVQRAGLKVLGPLQSGVSKVVAPFRDAWNWMGDLFSAQSQNKVLRKEVGKLQALVAHQLLLEQENRSLKQLLGVRDDEVYPSGTSFVTARVIARPTEAWYSTVTINAGSAKGIELYDPVVNEQNGLVGRITAVTSNAAQVTLLTDQESAVGAQVLPGEARGLVAGSLTGDLTMDLVDRSEKILPGQVVVTSGTSKVLSIPGIPIGIVEDVGKQDVELYQSVYIKPLVDFKRLQWVLVVSQ
jgi:rod shape-determining protein MreC